MNNFNYRSKIYLFFSSLFICALHLPFVFAMAKPVKTINASKTTAHLPSVATAVTASAISVKSIYDSLGLEAKGLSRQVFDYAITGLSYMKETSKVINDNIISIADFSKPSTKKRLYVIDLKNIRLLFNTYVAHGMNSGKEFANRFSNTPESNQSSPGFYETLGTYIGGNGYSLKLDGIERGINDNANSRAIVMHGADYVNEDIIRSQGFLGRSWGCPAVSQKLSKPIIDKIKNGTCLFIYSSDRTYANRSKIMSRCNALVKA